MCTEDEDCNAIHYNEESGICEMGVLKYRVDLPKGSGIQIKVDMNKNLPEKG